MPSLPHSCLLRIHLKAGFCLALLFALALGAADYFTMRQALENDFRHRIGVIAQAGTPDPADASAEQMSAFLKQFQSQEGMQALCIYDVADNLAAAWAAPNSDDPCMPIRSTLHKPVSWIDVNADFPLKHAGRLYGMVHAEGLLTELPAWLIQRAFLILGLLVPTLWICQIAARYSTDAVSAHLVAMAGHAEADDLPLEHPHPADRQALPAFPEAASREPAANHTLSAAPLAVAAEADPQRRGLLQERLDKEDIKCSRSKPIRSWRNGRLCSPPRRWSPWMRWKPASAGGCAR